MCELLVGLGEVDLVGINDLGEGARLEVVIRSRKARPVCGACDGSVWSKGYRTVVLVDLPAFGRPVRLGWRKRRWMCPNPDCGSNEQRSGSGTSPTTESAPLSTPGNPTRPFGHRHSPLKSDEPVKPQVEI